MAVDNANADWWEELKDVSEIDINRVAMGMNGAPSYFGLVLGSGGKSIVDKELINNDEDNWTFQNFESG